MFYNRILVNQLYAGLMANDYSIVDETIVEENRKLYEIIVAEKQSNPFLNTDRELLFGPV